jgi:putative ABC transport system substrate-binding protein
LLVGIHTLLTSAAEGQTARLMKIGALTDSWGPTNAIVGFRDGLSELGYRENQHFVLGVRFTQGDATELPAAARDLVKSFARPGGNITGVADLEAELVSKRMEILRELIPRLKRLFFVYDATNPGAVATLPGHRDAARRVGLTLIEKAVRTEDEARAAIAGVRKEDIDGMFASRHLSLNIPGLILEIAPKRSIPSMFQDAFFVEQAGLVSYAASGYDVGRQAARLADRIFKGARPSDVPVEQPTKFELVINVKSAKALGITVPPAILLRADRLIQ